MKIHLTQAEFSVLIENHQPIRIIDVRTCEEFLRAHIPDSINIPLSEIEAGKLIPDSGEFIITVCGKGGGRSESAAIFLRNTGHSRTYYLEGGTMGFIENLK